jgi:2-iminoacetate synthase
LTVRGRQVALGAEHDGATASGQFEIADERSPSEVADALRSRGLEAVWKDWDPAILAAS